MKAKYDRSSLGVGSEAEGGGITRLDICRSLPHLSVRKHLEGGALIDVLLKTNKKLCSCLERSTVCRFYIFLPKLKFF